MTLEIDTVRRADDPPAPTPSRPEPLRRGDVRLFTSEQLFAGGNEVQVEHEGATYRLRRTALGKLILTK